MTDQQYKRKIEEAAYRLKAEFERGLNREAGEIARDPKVIEYQREYQTPGWIEK